MNARLNKKQLPLLAAVLAFLPIPVFAHTGIGSIAGFWHGIAHPFSGADHLLAMLAVGLWAVQIGGRALWVVPSAFVALMLAGGILGIANIPLPYVEAGILLSVLMLGVLIAGAFRFSLAASRLVVGMFAVFHGYAHGAEVPIAMGVIDFSAGFIAATMLLHAVGIAGGLLLQKLKMASLTRFSGALIASGGVYLGLVHVVQ